MDTFCKASFGIDILTVLVGDVSLVAFTTVVEGCKVKLSRLGRCEMCDWSDLPRVVTVCCLHIP